MEIDGINRSLWVDSAVRGKEKDSSPPVVQDSVILSGRRTLASVSATSVVNEIFKSRQVVWTSGQKGDSSTGKGLIAVPGGDMLAGSYCDLKKISKKDGTVIWEKDISAKSHNLSSSPAVVAKDGSYLIGTTDGTLFSLDPDTGAEKWSYRTGSYDTKPMQAPDGTIFVQKNRDIAAVSPDGKEKFSTPLGIDRLEISHVDTAGAAYVHNLDDIIAIGPDGRKRWQVPGSSVRGFPDDPGHVFTTANKDILLPDHKGTTMHTLLSARDSKTGKKLWEHEYDYARVGGYNNGKLYVYEHDNISALDSASGKVLWEYPGTQQRQIRVVLNDGTLILSTPGQIEAVDGQTGRQKWAVDAKSLNSDPPAYETADGKILINDRHTIYSIDSASGTVEFRFKMDDEIHKITPTSDGSLVIVEEAGTGLLKAIDFRPMSAVAEEIIEKTADSGANPGSIQVEDDYVIIDGIKIPRGNSGRSK